MSANIFGQLKFLSNGNGITLQSAPNLATSYTLQLPSTSPNNNQILVWNNATGALDWTNLLNNTSLSSNNAALTVSGEGGAFTLSFANQNANLAFLSPASGNGAPSFRGITNADLPNIDASKITGTLSTAIIPAGTDASTFQLAVSGLGVKLVNSGGTALLLQRNDGTPAGLSVGDLTVTGTTTTINSETLTINDNIIVLNNNVATGTPSENAGVEVRRGASASATLLWDESIDRWSVGVVGSLVGMGYKLTRTFTSTDLASGILTWVHNQNSRYFTAEILNASYQTIGVSATSSDANTVTFDLSNLTITGTWYAVLFI